MFRMSGMFTMSIKTGCWSLLSNEACAIQESRITIIILYDSIEFYSHEFLCALVMRKMHKLTIVRIGALFDLRQEWLACQRGLDF